MSQNAKMIHPVMSEAPTMKNTRGREWTDVNVILPGGESVIGHLDTARGRYVYMNLRLEDVTWTKNERSRRAGWYKFVADAAEHVNDGGVGAFDLTKPALM